MGHKSLSAYTDPKSRADVGSADFEDPFFLLFFALHFY